MFPALHRKNVERDRSSAVLFSGQGSYGRADEQGRRSRDASPTSAPCSAKGRCGSSAKRRSTGSTSRAGRSSASTSDGAAARMGDAVPRRLAGAAREGRVHRRDRPRLRRRSTSTRAASTPLRHPEPERADQPLQRRQGRPRGPLLGGDDGRRGEGRDAGRSTASTPTRPGRGSTTAIASPTARRSAARGRSCITMIRARQVTYAFDLDARRDGDQPADVRAASARATAIPTG